MVVFTCNHCGDSLQKPKVAKHYQFQCRKYPDLTCVDCHKDFRGEEFVDHTQCITENQRYGGQDYVQKPNANKGERKQNEWINVVQNVLTDDKTLSGQERNFLQQIAKNQNIPRKKVKFMNFVKSSYGNRVNWTVVESVWDKMESSFKKNKESNNKNNEKDDKPKRTENDNTENAQTENDNNENTVKESHRNSTNGATEKKKKSKKKKIEETNEEKIENPIEESHSEKKKSKKRKLENGNVEKTEEDADVIASKNSAENQNNENLQRENGNEENNKSEDSGKKKKSKKRKLPSEPETLSANNEEVSVDEKGEETTDKVLKKRKLESTEQEGEKADVKTETDINEIVTIKKARNDLSKFDWKQAINEIMTKKSKDGRLPVRKLQKKVVGRYLHSHYKMTKEEAISKFDKILRRMKDYTIENEVVNMNQS